MTMVLSTGCKIQMLKAKAPTLDTYTIQLFTNQPTLTRDTKTSDFVQPNYLGGNSRAVGPWGNARLSNDLVRCVISAPVVIWTRALFVPATTVWGYYFTDVNGFFMFGDYFTDGPFKTASVLPFFSFGPLLFEDTMTATNAPSP